MRKVAMEVPKGLEGVEVDVTKISLVDGERGRLSYRGHDVAQLIEWPFSRVVLLVVTGEDPSAAECSAFETALLRASRLSADDAGLLTLAAKTQGASDGRAARAGAVAVAVRRSSKATATRRTDSRWPPKMPSLIAGPASAAQWRSASRIAGELLDPNARFLAQMGSRIRSPTDARIQRHPDPADRTQLQRQYVRRARCRKHAGAGGERTGRCARRIARRAARRCRSGRARNGDRSRRPGARRRFRRRMSGQRTQDHGHGTSRVPRARSAGAFRQSARRRPRERHPDGTVVPDARSHRSANLASGWPNAAPNCMPTSSSTRASCTAPPDYQWISSLPRSRCRASTAISRTSSRAASTTASSGRRRSTSVSSGLAIRLPSYRCEVVGAGCVTPA